MLYFGCNCARTVPKTLSRGLSCARTPLLVCFAIEFR